MLKHYKSQNRASTLVIASISVAPQH